MEQGLQILWGFKYSITVHIHHTHLYNRSTPSCYSSTCTADINEYCSELIPCTAIAYSYWIVSTIRINAKAMHINDTDYNCHAYNSCRTCLTLTNHHIKPLIINSLGCGHTHSVVMVTTQYQLTLGWIYHGIVHYNYNLMLGGDKVRFSCIRIF